MPPRTPTWVVGNPHDRSIRGFCVRHGTARGPMSRSKYFRLRKAGLGPVETPVAGGIIITVENERAWERDRTNPTDTTEQKLQKRMKAKRIRRARKASRASVEGDNHVSKRQHREM